jgi:MerR family transcriptional regulator/heat shock protein HspR
VAERTYRRDEVPVYVISVAAELAGVHPRTLRIYEAKGLIRPARRKHIRLFSEQDVQRVRLIQYLTQEVGLNLAGVRLFLEIQERHEEVARWLLELCDTQMERRERR